MNHEDNTAQPNAGIPAELEVRIIAWILGEASAFEIAELERLVAERPELARFRIEMESIHGLVNEATHPDREPLRLAPERRARLLKVIGLLPSVEKESSVREKPAEPKVSVFPVGAGRKDRPNWTRRGSVIAACVAAGFALQTLLKNRERPFNEAVLKQESVAVEERKKAVELGRVYSIVEGDGSHNSDVSPMRKDQSQLSLGQLAGKNKKRANSPAEAPSIESSGAGLSSDAEVKLEPFVVSEKVDRTYYSSNTLAGTRETSSRSRIVPQFSAPESAPNFFGPTGDANGSLAVSPSAPRDEPKKTFYYSHKPAELSARSAGKDEDKTKEEVSVDAFGKTDAKNVAEFTQNMPKLQDSAGSVEIDRGSSSLLFGVGSPTRTVNPAASESSDRGYIAPVATIPDAAKLDQPLPKAPTPPPVLPTTSESSTAKEPVSTFSLHVSDVSFNLSKAALARGEKPDPASIRPEEFYNAFDYGDPAPAMGDRISCRIEQSAHPSLQQRNLVRIAMKVPATGREAGQPLHLTVLLDTSGSMEREDRAASVQQALKVLISLLGPNDRITLIGFARQPRLIAEQLSGDKAGQLLELLAHIPAEGGTNLEEALKLGTQLAERQFEPSAQNRIVLLTDGAANLGSAVPAQLSPLIETLRQKQIAFDACGVGLDGIDDTMLESLTRKGDGRYYVLNTPEAADAGFVRQLAGAFRPAAENVKVQVRFNPARVRSHRLLGFDQHRLNQEDFRNDKVDAAELAAEEAAVALYQVEVLPQGEGELGEVFVRFRDATTKEMIERSWTLTYDPAAPTFDRATPTLQLAGAAALLAEKLRGGPAGDAIKWDELAPVMTTLRRHFAKQPRVQELVTMFEQARRLNRE